MFVQKIIIGLILYLSIDYITAGFAEVVIDRYGAYIHKDFIDAFNAILPLVMIVVFSSIKDFIYFSLFVIFAYFLLNYYFNI